MAFRFPNLQVLMYCCAPANLHFKKRQKTKNKIALWMNIHTLVFLLALGFHAWHHFLELTINLRVKRLSKQTCYSSNPLNFEINRREWMFLPPLVNVFWEKKIFDNYSQFLDWNCQKCIPFNLKFAKKLLKSIWSISPEISQRFFPTCKIPSTALNGMFLIK